jgi:hypothetical protein
MIPVTKNYSAGTHLFREKDRSRELYIINTGVVQAYRKIGNFEVELARMEKGAVVGEMALIDGKPRSASARALTDCSVIIIDADSFHSKIKGIPPWFLSLVRMTSSKIRKANKRLQIRHLRYRGFNIIIVLNYLSMESTLSPPEIELKQLQRKLIQLLGTTHQRIVRILEFMEQHLFIEIQSGKITITDPERLHKYCRFLRLVMRKVYEPMNELLSGMHPFFEKGMELFPSIAADPSGQTEISSDQFSQIFEQSGFNECRGEIIDILKNCAVIGVNKKIISDSRNERGGYIYSLNNEVWNAIALHYTFEHFIPEI